MSKETLELHWGKHHRGYVDKLNKQIANTDFERYNLEDLINVSYNNGNPQPIFNNAAQVWNHDFFWDTLRPHGGKEPSGQVLDRITKQFGSYDAFVEDFKHAATTLFGSGWVWLSLKKDTELVVEKSLNAINPLVWDHIPLLSLDIWEHAYYLDFQNERGAYINMFFDNLINWEAVENRLNRAKGFIGLGDIIIPSVESIQEREKRSYYV
ncbi:hypothetical protein O6H91_20G005900 [Diphasiastrum complanatum]|uniref:Uncharacterized protein n=1 Tax=Diphasiastrum complanatum TaxID=34168 RepID=A0ACC2AME9_DIPCM|nr:hypothetical protein O6H91_20G005900 [Diphasiastrum complanatum]